MKWGWRVALVVISAAILQRGLAAQVRPFGVAPDLLLLVAVAAGIAAGRNGQYQAGLHAAWQLAATHVGGPVAAFFAAEEGAMRDHLQRRNDSILAHGFTPVRAEEWQAFAAWLEAAFVPLLTGLLARQGLQPFPQLPDAPPGEGEAP